VIWVSKPNDFNDPFEYSFRVIPDMPLVEVIKRKADATQKNYLEKQLELIQNIKDKFEVGGIFSLSKSNRISLMWSHYANSHYGFCVGYRVKSSNDLGNGKCESVDYGKFQSFSLMEMWRGVEQNEDRIAKKMFKAMVLAKDPNWKYEREKRVLYSQSNQLVIPNFNITSITFGLRMQESYRKIIIKLMEGKEIKYFKVEKRKDSYDLSPLPYET
jgi:hypothetical protein